MDGGHFSASIRLEPFRPEFMDRIVLRWPEAIGDLATMRDAVSGQPEHARMAFLGERLVGAGGALRLWPGVGLAWVAVEILPPRLAFAAIRTCREGLDQIFAHGQFHRVQADIRRDFMAAHRLAVLLGFSYEGPMNGYSADKSDYDRYARVMK